MWAEVRNIIESLLPIQQRHIVNVDLILLNFPKLTKDRELVWILGSYLTEVWLESEKNCASLSRGRVFGFLKYKYKMYRRILNIKELE